MWKPRKEKEFIEMVPIVEELVSPEEVVAIITESKSEVKSVTYQPPLHIGYDNFGAFRVEWKTPRYHKMNLENV